MELKATRLAQIVQMVARFTTPMCARRNATTPPHVTAICLALAVLLKHLQSVFFFS